MLLKSDLTIDTTQAAFGSITRAERAKKKIKKERAKKKIKKNKKRSRVNLGVYRMKEPRKKIKIIKKRNKDELKHLSLPRFERAKKKKKK